MPLRCVDFFTAAGRGELRAIVFYGHPDYYPRFGFRSAAAFGITNPDGKNFDALMAMALYDGALDGVSGVFYEDEAFNINTAAAEKTMGISRTRKAQNRTSNRRFK